MLSFNSRNQHFFEMNLEYLLAVIFNLALCTASNFLESQNYLTEYSNSGPVNLTQLTECLKRISTDITLDASVWPLSGTVIFDLFANITNYGEVREDMVDMTTSIHERARTCLKQQGLPGSVQVWLYSKQNTRKLYPSGYGERFGCVQVVDTSKNYSTRMLESIEDDDLHDKSHIEWRSRRGNPASSKGQPVSVIDGFSIFLYSGSMFASSVL